MKDQRRRRRGGKTKILLWVQGIHCLIKLFHLRATIFPELPPKSILISYLKRVRDINNLASSNPTAVIMLGIATCPLQIRSPIRLHMGLGTSFKNMIESMQTEREHADRTRALETALDTCSKSSIDVELREILDSIFTTPFEKSAKLFGSTLPQTKHERERGRDLPDVIQ